MSDIWTVKRILEWIEGYLAEKGIDNPRLSAQWLVSDALDCSRLELYTDFERPLTDAEREVLRGYTKRRGEGEPLQYITGKTDFRFVTLLIEPGVLIPRPETEVLVSEALAYLKNFLQNDENVSDNSPLVDDGDFEDRHLLIEEDLVDGASLASESTAEDVPEIPKIVVVDMCTGSGNIACSIAHELPNSQVYATDISPTAIALATRNAEVLGLSERITVLESDMESALPSNLLGGVQLLVSNPPYIPSAVVASLDAEVADYEPALALDGGSDGLDYFRRILTIAHDFLSEGGILAVELFEGSLEQAARLAGDAGFQDVRIARDLAGNPRILLAHNS